MKNRFDLILALSVSLSGLAFIGCSDTIDEITNTISCHSVCDRYSECFNADYDVDGCTDRCENDASSDEDREARLKSCNDCIDERSCTGAAFACADNCAGIVP